MIVVDTLSYINTKEEYDSIITFSDTDNKPTIVFIHDTQTTTNTWVQGLEGTDLVEEPGSGDDEEDVPVDVGGAQQEQVLIDTQAVHVARVADIQQRRSYQRSECASMCYMTAVYLPILTFYRILYMFRYSEKGFTDYSNVNQIIINYTVCTTLFPLLPMVMLCVFIIIYF